eukprot:12043734-Prorocentrum_lima.AAC.1
MTSSLVGSEMCIRDRFFFSVKNDAEWQVGVMLAKIFDPAVWWSGEVSVSYTHLTLPTICSV